MEEWDDIEQEIQKLEEEYANDDEVLRCLAAPASSDYWKKRLEEEKSLKGEENKVMEAKLKQQETEITTLRNELKHMRESIKQGQQEWQQELKVKETELLLDKERVQWNEKVRDLDYNTEKLLEQIEQLRQSSQKKEEELTHSYKRDLEEITKSRDELFKNIELLENELSAIKDTDEKNRESLQSVVEKNAYLEVDNKELKYASDRQKEIYITHLSSILDYFVPTLKDYSGTITGLINYSVHNIRSKFWFGRKRTLLRQLSNVRDMVNKILSVLQETSSVLLPEKLELQETTVDRFLVKLSDDIDTTRLPEGLKVKSDIVKLKRAFQECLKPTVNITAEHNITPAGQDILLRIAFPDKIRYDEKFINLKHVLFLHNWHMSVENNIVLISIPCSPFVKGDNKGDLKEIGI